MSENRVNAKVVPADKTAIMTDIEAIRSKLPPPIDMSAAACATRFAACAGEHALVTGNLAPCAACQKQTAFHGDGIRCEVCRAVPDKQTLASDFFGSLYRKP